MPSGCSGEATAPYACSREALLAAHLQLDDSQFSDLVEELQAQFPFAGYIYATARRGISLGQLERIRAFAEGHCCRWHDTTQPASTSRKMLDMSFLNLYHLNAWCILPATSANDCAMVELLAREPQTPEWFCSHWWGEPIRDFVACVQKHASVRQLPQDAFYWVCAYANRQHELGQELQADPHHSSFYKAMQLSKGVLLILDECGPATPFTRIWCAFEEATAIKTERLVLDIVTAGGGTGGDLLAGSLAGAERALQEAGHVNHGYLLKLARESTFPIEVLKKGLELEIQSAKASKEEDRRHILNALAERHLDGDPAEAHEKYDEVNLQLRATFALAVWMQATARGDINVLRRLHRALQEDRWRRALHMDFSILQAVLSDGTAADVARALPPALEILNLDLRGCENLGDEGVAALAAALPRLPQLQRLTLVFRSTKFGDRGMAALARTLPGSTRVEELCIDCCGCDKRLGAQGLAALGAALPGLIQLRKLHLNLRWTYVRAAGVAALARGLPSTLQELRLALDSDVESSGLAALAAGLPEKLQWLDLHVADLIRRSGSEGGIMALAAGVRRLPGLRHVNLMEWDRMGVLQEHDATWILSQAEALSQRGHEASSAAEPAAPIAAAAPAAATPQEQPLSDGEDEAERPRATEALRVLRLRPPEELLPRDDYWLPLAAALRHTPLVGFEMDCRRCEISEVGLAAVAAALPGSLKELRLLGATEIKASGLAALAAGLPPSLRQLTCDLWKNPCCDDGFLGAFAAHLPAGLEELDVACSNCENVTDSGIAALAVGLPGTLTSLSLDFSYVAELADASLAALGRALRSSLSELRLCFALCGRITDAGAAALVAGLPGKLTTLCLDFTDDAELTDASLAALGAALPASLLELRLRLALCGGITNSGAAALVAGLPGTLSTLRLEMADLDADDVEGAQAWARSFPGLMLPTV